MLLIYEDDADRVANMDERMPTCAAYAEAMKKAGIYVVGERLRAAGTTTSVRRFLEKRRHERMRARDS